MSRLIQRAVITTSVLAQLRTTNRPVGDAEMPRGGTAGWIGQPNAEGTNFVSYSVLTPASAQLGAGPLVDPGADTNFGYVITSYGVSRAQCEDQADAMRFAVIGLSGRVITMWANSPVEYGRTIQTVLFTGYGAVQPMGPTDPKFYGQSDTIAVLTTG